MMGLSSKSEEIKQLMGANMNKVFFCEPSESVRTGINTYFKDSEEFEKGYLHTCKGKR